MTKKSEYRFTAIEEVLKRNDPKETQNIMDSIRDMKRMEPQDASEIDAYFDQLCKEYDYDPADLTTAKEVETI